MVDRLDHEEQFLFKEEVLQLAEALSDAAVSRVHAMGLALETPVEVARESSPPSSGAS